MDSATILKEILEKEKPRKVLLFADSAYEKSGAKEKLSPVLKSFEVEVFSDIAPNPTLEQIEKGIGACKSFGPDLVVAVGGGSVLDTAKAANLLAAQEGTPVSYIKKEKEIAKQGKPLVAIPTTAGTGAEATRFAVVYIDNIKYSFSHEFLLPRYAVIDAELTYSLPPNVTADSGMDALAQAIEAFWST
ncbi:MAG TPA: iron-containing alcohol dehydrogenase, partial [Candidatus Paceibacterota bacterium]|nr:iron-containing alcohol dehydrogenase [Candidatus Paceibacterota bacterium]